MNEASHHIIRAVSERSNTPPADLEPLYGAVDPDAVDELVGSSSPGSRLTVTFQYSGYTVTVAADGTVELAEPVTTPAHDS